MLGFHFLADQFTNYKIMIDKWNIGFRLNGGSHTWDNKMKARTNISNTIKKLFKDEEGREMKKNVEALRDCMKIVVQGRGSLNKHLEIFISGLKALTVELKGKQERTPSSIVLFMSYLDPTFSLIWLLELFFQFCCRYYFYQCSMSIYY